MNSILDRILKVDEDKKFSDFVCTVRDRGKDRS
jgi:hypothetical protein